MAKANDEMDIMDSDSSNMDAAPAVDPSSPMDAQQQEEPMVQVKQGDLTSIQSALSAATAVIGQYVQTEEGEEGVPEEAGEDLGTGTGEVAGPDDAATSGGIPSRSPRKL